MKNDKMVVGNISGVHGIKGEVKIYPMTDDVQRFLDFKYLYYKGEKLDIETVRIHKNSPLIKFKQVKDRTQAESMRGYVEVLREDAAPLNEGEFYIEDLKGLKMLDINSDKEGVLVDILKTGSVDVIEFKLGDEVLLMPYLNEYVEEVNIEEGYMRADFTKGVN